MMPDSSARLRILDLWVRTVFRRRQLQDAAVLAAGYRVIIDGASSRCERESGRMCDDGIGLLSQCARCMAGLFRKGRVLSTVLPCPERSETSVGVDVS